MLTTIQSPQELIHRTRERLYNRNKLSSEDFQKQASWLINNARRFGMHYELKAVLADEPIRQTKTAANQEEYPVRNPTELQKAIDWFMQYRHQLPYEKRRKLACKLLKKASEYGRLPPEELQMLEKSAGLGFSTIEDIKKQIELRKHYVINRGMDKLASILEGVEGILNKTNLADLYSSATARKIARTIDAVDKLARITPNKNGFRLAEDFIFDTPQSAINEEFDLIANVKTGNYYNRHDIGNIDLDLLDAYLGCNTVQAMTVLDHLDPDYVNAFLSGATTKQAELFDRAAKMSGVFPYAVKTPKKDSTG